MPSIAFRPEAEAELAEAVDWYEARGRGLGAEFLRALDAVLAFVQRNPHAYPIVLAPARLIGCRLLCQHGFVGRKLARKLPQLHALGVEF